ncbi:AraC family transcriptional regulator [Paenibacillus mendelii]|uniref:Helix-turn-helix domain-containing protein n=1 Tax=Paenibacillus mendelii TaxID=206163 RepID=A0ABV6JEF0_9BACL|nr:AraC family transcriptional regulator [Paenibacillus mendelii]MCQ6558607.1 AraC family transcriptional regulator [Paenibacillus mendelii]
MNFSFDFLHHTVREGQSRIDDHSHANYELVYYVNGTGTTKIGDTCYPYSGGTFTIIQPGCKHDEYRETDTEVIFICFYYDNDRVRFDNGLYEDREGTIRGLLEQMLSELGSKENYYDISLHGLLCQLIAASVRLVSGPLKQETSDKVIYAKKYMEQYCTDKIDMVELAGSLGYSYDHFRHFFKQKTGYSPTQYMIRNRLEQAKRMLLYTDKTATEVALECGFSNAPQFSMMFKKDTGSSPRAYREHFLHQNL